MKDDDDGGVRCRPDKRGDAVGLCDEKPSSLHYFEGIFRPSVALSLARTGSNMLKLPALSERSEFCGAEWTVVGHQFKWYAIPSELMAQGVDSVAYFLRRQAVDFEESR